MSTTLKTITLYEIENGRQFESKDKAAHEQRLMNVYRNLHAALPGLAFETLTNLAGALVELAPDMRNKIAVSLTEPIGTGATNELRSRATPVAPRFDTAKVEPFTPKASDETRRTTSTPPTAGAI